MKSRTISKKCNQSVWQDNELALIEAVKKYPILYKKQFNNIRRRDDVKQNCWVAIGAELGISENKCKYMWYLLRNAYVRSKKSGTSAKYDSTLDFLDPEIKPNHKESNKTNSETSESEDEEISEQSEAGGNSKLLSNNQSKKITVISLSSDNDGSTDDDEPISRLIPKASIERSASKIQLCSGLSFEKNFPSTSYDQNSNTKIPEETKIYVFGSHIVKKTNLCLETTKSIRLEHPEKDDHPINENDPKRFKPSSCNFTMFNSSNEDIESKPELLTSKAETPTDESCKDIKVFFSDLSSYIKSKFSLKKQKDIQLRIYSMLSSEELKRYK